MVSKVRHLRVIQRHSSNIFYFTLKKGRRGTLEVPQYTTLFEGRRAILTDGSQTSRHASASSASFHRSTQFSKSLPVAVKPSFSDVTIQKNRIGNAVEVLIQKSTPVLRSPQKIDVAEISKGANNSTSVRKVGIADKTDAIIITLWGDDA